ncbi:hypothetical protein F7725_014968 [Dissostichus mawsoni]|uniref:Uncharacterized protein n=1 Tax=Dissostichus mawsoni TaxID=36200 RepID=A0A7J5YHN5_DISMA|nr:hypothetical protein F7725_014968 [Dissostichus mawsoni]
MTSHLLDGAHHLELGRGVEVVPLFAQQQAEIPRHVSAGDVHPHDGVRDGESFVDRDHVGHPVARVQNHSGGPARRITAGKTQKHTIRSLGPHLEGGGSSIDRGQLLVQIPGIPRCHQPPSRSYTATVKPASCANNTTPSRIEELCAEFMLTSRRAESVPMALAEETPENPFAAVGVVVGSVYWSAVTYGAVVGHKKGLHVMERADPLFLLMGLPTIPVPADGLAAGDHLSVSRTLCGALVFPTIASLVGRLLFRKMPSNLQRTVLGGIAFVLIKGVMKVYFKQQQCTNQASRHILDYYPETQTEGQSDGAEDEDTEDSGNE